MTAAGGQMAGGGGGVATTCCLYGQHNPPTCGVGEGGGGTNQNHSYTEAKTNSFLARLNCMCNAVISVLDSSKLQWRKI